MKQVSVFTLLTNDQDEALSFYTEKLGFAILEDGYMGDYRWVTISLPGNKNFGISLETAKTESQKALVGKQAADMALFGFETDDCIREFQEMKTKGVVFEGESNVQPFGTGVMLKDLYGNRIYMNQVN